MIVSFDYIVWRTPWSEQHSRIHFGIQEIRNRIDMWSYFEDAHSRMKEALICMATDIF